MGGITALFFKIIPLMVMEEKRCGNCIYTSFELIFNKALMDML